MCGISHTYSPTLNDFTFNLVNYSVSIISVGVQMFWKDFANVNLNSLFSGLYLKWLIHSVPCTRQFKWKCQFYFAAIVTPVLTTNRIKWSNKCFYDTWQKNYKNEKKQPNNFQSIRGNFIFILITFNEMGKKIWIAHKVIIVTHHS